MKNILLALVLLGCQGLNAQQPLKLSLAEAIDYAMQHQPGYQNYKVDQQIATAKKLGAIGGYLPKLNGSYDMRNNLKLGEIALKFPNPITGLEQDLRIKQGTRYLATAGVDLNQPLLDLAAISDIKYTKSQQQLSALQLQQATIDLKVNISRAYYLVLLNNERVDKAGKSVDRFKKAYDDTKLKFDNQAAIKTDLNRAFLNLSNAEYQFKIAKDSVKTSLLYLGQLIGANTTEAIELTDTLPAETSADVLPEYPDYKSAELNRVELKAENMQLQLNKQQLKKVDYQYVPTINGYGFIGGQGLDNDKLFKKEAWYWNSYIGLRVSISIFDGLQKTALHKQQQLLISKNENNINTIRNNISYQLQTAAVNYANASNNIALIKQNVQLAEEVVQDVNLRYQNGLATYQEVLDAENTLKDTEFNYLQAMYAYLVAQLDWKKANGKL